MTMFPEQIHKYLQRARQLHIIPNFWLTQEYLSIQDAEFHNNGKVIWIQEDDWAIFPPLPLRHPLGDPGTLRELCPPLKIWSDFENYHIGDELGFLDWEYTYEPSHFADMSGGKWKVFRKNCRKWPRANPCWEYVPQIPPSKAIDRLLINWFLGHDEIEDDNSLLWFVYNGKFRDFLYSAGKLVGINVYDVNSRYVMYRYCITDPDEPYLDEFNRLLFYQKLPPGYLVIDGGTLGSAGLERFKDKLNPIKKREVYSRILE